MEKKNPDDLLNKIRKMSSIDERPSLSDSTIEILIENTIQSISTCINNEFNNNSNTKDESLFCLPDMLGFDLLSKIQLARDLADLLYTSRSKRNSIMPNQSIDSLRNYRPSNLLTTPKDLLQSIINSDVDGLYVSSADAEFILNIILSC